MKKSEDICIRQPKVNYNHQTNNKYYIFLKTKGSDEKLIQYFKHAMKKAFSINEKNIINTKIIRLNNFNTVISTVKVEIKYDLHKYILNRCY